MGAPTVLNFSGRAWGVARLCEKLPSCLVKERHSPNTCIVRVSEARIRNTVFRRTYEFCAEMGRFWPTCSMSAVASNGRHLSSRNSLHLGSRIVAQVERVLFWRIAKRKSKFGSHLLALETWLAAIAAACMKSTGGASRHSPLCCCS
jgi:hypothetical protein